jgi:hypothetical protein
MRMILQLGLEYEEGYPDKTVPFFVVADDLTEMRRGRCSKRVSEFLMLALRRLDAISSERLRVQAALQDNEDDSSRWRRSGPDGRGPA